MKQKNPSKRPEILKCRFIEGFRRKHWKIVEANRKGEILCERECTRKEYLQTLLKPSIFIWIVKEEARRKFRGLRNFLLSSIPKEGQ